MQNLNVIQNSCPDHTHSTDTVSTAASENNCIRLPAIRSEFGQLNAKYQMHFRLRELANPSNPPLYPNINIDNDVTTRSLTGFSKHIKSKFLSGYSLHCDIGECYACNNS